MTRKMTLQRVFRAVASCAFASALFVACKGEEIPTLPPDDEPSNEDAGNNQPNHQGDSGINLACLRPATDCPCGIENAQNSCSVYYTVLIDGQDEKIACATGYMLCLDGEWSECYGVRVVVVPPSEIPPGTLIHDEAPAFAGDAGL